MKIAQRAAAALLLCSFVQNAISFPAASLIEQEEEGDETRKVLGSSVVTSVSVIMDLGNGSQAFADSTGRPVPKPASASHLSSPPSLMSPDRYEFYTFNDAGDLVKRLMTMDEIQGLIAGESVEIGSDLPGLDPEEVDQVEERPPAFFFLPHPMEKNPDWSPPGVDKVVKRVQDVLADVQNKITVDESHHHHHPSWAINRPESDYTQSHPTQNIPGSNLHLLKNPADKFSTFVPPVHTFTPGNSVAVEKVTENTYTEPETNAVPSSTPTFAPVSSTIQASTTATMLKVTETPVVMPVSTTRFASTTTTTSTEAPTTTSTTPKTTTQLRTTTTAPRTTSTTTKIATTTPPAFRATTPTPRTTTTSSTTVTTPRTTNTPSTTTTTTSTTTRPTTQRFTTEKATTVPQKQHQSTLALKEDQKYEKLPEISVKPPSGQPEIKIPSTIIADLLIEDAQEIIRHDTLTTITAKNPTSQSTTQKYTPSTSTVATRTTTTPTTTVAKRPTTQIPVEQFITTKTSVKSTSTTPQTVTTKTPSFSTFVPIISSQTKFTSTAAPVKQENPTTEQYKLASVLTNTASKLNNTSSSSTAGTVSTSATEIVQTNFVKISTAQPSQSSSSSKNTTPMPLKTESVTSSLKTGSSISPVSFTTPTPLKKTTFFAASNSQPSTVQQSTVTQKTPTTQYQPTKLSTSNIEMTPEQTLSFPKITLPPLDELKLQMDQITQTLTDTQSSSVKPIMVSTLEPKKPAVVVSSLSTVTFGSTSSSSLVQTGKTTPPPKTTARTTNAPIKTTQKLTTEKWPEVEETTTDSFMFETLMTTLNLPPVAADSLVLDEVTSKTSDIELSDMLPEQNNKVRRPENSSYEESFEMDDESNDNSVEDQTESLEVTDKIETDDVVPFVSQIFDNIVGSNSFDSSSEEESTENSSDGSSEEEQEAYTEKVAMQKPITKESTTLKTTVVPLKSSTLNVANITFERVPTKSPKPPLTGASVVNPTTKIQPPKPTASASLLSSMKPENNTPTQFMKDAIPTTYTVQVTPPAKPYAAQFVSNSDKVITNKYIQSNNSKNGTQNKATTQNASGEGSALTTKLTNSNKNEDSKMSLISTTEYSVNPTTIRHASTVKVETNGQGHTAPSTSKPVNMVNKNNLKEVLDTLLAPAGILNFGDSSEEAIKEDIYTTFIPASTTAKNTSPHPTEEKKVIQNVDAQKKNLTTAHTQFNQLPAAQKPTTKAPQINPVYTKVTLRPHSSTVAVKTTTEKIPDLEVSWQEPPEVVWTAEKSTVSPKKPVTTTPFKSSTTAAMKVTPVNTKVTSYTTQKTTNAEGDQTIFTKSNDDGMELIAVSDKLRPSTPPVSLRPNSNMQTSSNLFNLKPAAANNLGLEATTVMLDEDIRRFIDLNNDIAIRMYKHITSELDKKRSIAVSPFGATSLIAMVFIGARGQTSAQINDFLPFDDMITFNPHLVMRNITDSVIMSPDLLSAAIVRQLYSQKGTKELLDFYKARAGAFYDGLVQQTDFEDISTVVKERTNHLIKTQTSNKVPHFLGESAILRLRPPLAALSTNVFQMNCALSSSQGSRDGEILFHGEKLEESHILPSTVWSGEFMIGYDVGLDATAVEIPHSNSPAGALTSTVFVMPGKPGTNSNAGIPLLARLEARLISRRAWSGLLRNLQRSPDAVDIQVPRFEHRSVLNLTTSLERMGLNDLFTEGVADLRGVNGLQDMYLSDLTQMNVFSFCSTPNAEGHVETYPSTKRTGRLGSRGGEDYEDEYDWRMSGVVSLPLPLRPRQARIPMSENLRIKLDRPFMYFVRHNPTGMILHIGRFNPRFDS